jgi:hypothetical protein
VSTTATVRSIAIEDITLHGDTQPRVDIDLYVVDEYAAAMEDGATFPPIIVFFDGARNWLVDGFHRWHAARKAKLDKIKCAVHKGTLEEARWFSYSVNPAHGLRRSNADKQKAVTAALRHPSGAGMSDRQIAEHVGVSRDMVIRYRHEMEDDGTCNPITSRTGSDGRTINTANIGKRATATKKVGPLEVQNVGSLTTPAAGPLVVSRSATVATPPADPVDDFVFEEPEEEGVEIGEGKHAKKFSAKALQGDPKLMWAAERETHDAVLAVLNQWPEKLKAIAAISAASGISEFYRKSNPHTLISGVSHRLHNIRDDDVYNEEVANLRKILDESVAQRKNEQNSA